VSVGGPSAMFRGVSAQFTGCGPAHALYFGAYEGIKQLLVAGRSSGHLSLPLAHATAGAVATVCHDGLMTPFDVVKQRMQLGDGSGNHRNFVTCMRSIHRAEGTAAFFVSFRTTVRVWAVWLFCTQSCTHLSKCTACA
jgi:solute carrier family 25 iron transporter 28/37